MEATLAVASSSAGLAAMLEPSSLVPSSISLGVAAPRIAPVVRLAGISRMAPLRCVPGSPSTHRG
jgi:hypothetical protein